MLTPFVITAVLFHCTSYCITGQVSESTDDGADTGAIVGGVVGGLAVIALAAVAIAALTRKPRAPVDVAPSTGVDNRGATLSD